MDLLLEVVQKIIKEKQGRKLKAGNRGQCPGNNQKPNKQTYNSQLQQAEIQTEEHGLFYNRKVNSDQEVNLEQ